MKTVTISRFRRDCTGLMEAARLTGAPLVVTHKGRPVAQVVPFRPVAEPRTVPTETGFAERSTAPSEGRWS